MAEWISVKDGLPEDQRSVLTVNGHGEIRIMGLWRKRGDEWTWVHNGHMMHYNDITHWMPLPEPPKESNSLGKPENCEYYTTSCFWGGGGCLGTREIDSCEGKDCKRYQQGYYGYCRAHLQPVHA